MGRYELEDMGGPYVGVAGRPRWVESMWEEAIETPMW